MATNPSPTQLMVRAILREAGPLNVDELLARVPEWRPPRSKNRKEGIRNAIANDQLCQNRGDGHYVYLPTALHGAAVRGPVVAVEGAPRGLSVGVEAAILLWPHDEELRERSVPSRLLALADGPIVALSWNGWLRSDAGYGSEKAGHVLPDPPFWDWWTVRQCRGADTLIVRCEDHEAGHFSARALASAELDAANVAVSNERLREAAVAVVKGTRGMTPTELARRLLGRGVYHAEMPPDPLVPLLLTPPSPFIVEWGYAITYRPGLTPAVWRVLRDRLMPTWEEDHLDAQPFRPPPRVAPPRDVPPAAACYRIKVSLAWDRKVWRIVEILDNQTLEDLHDAIQDAFDWDDDHLYAFYLGGELGDMLTAVGRPTGEDWDDPPTADQVLLADLDLQPEQRLPYRFDFGDQLDHELVVQATLPPPASGQFPRVVEQHGVPPPQYDVVDEDDEEAFGLVVGWHLPPE